MHDDQPQMVGGWEFTQHGDIEKYRRRLANRVTVFATWENKAGSGTVEARVEPLGIGRTLTRSRKDFRDKEAFWTAAHCVVEMAANLPSLDAGRESPAESALFEKVAGNVEATPGATDAPEAELTFTLVNGRTVTLILSDEQAFDLIGRIHQLDEHVWEQLRDEDDVEEDDEFIADDTEDIEVPDVSGVRSVPDTEHDVATLLGAQFGIAQAHLMSHVDGSALVVVGEPAVSSLIQRGDELRAALRPNWQPEVVDRPGEQWLALHRNAVPYYAE
jgi:hypothetical protein